MLLRRSFMNQGGMPNKIWYTTTDGVAVTLGSTDFGANILTHTYEDGYGVITFDSAVTRIGAYTFAECSTLASITIPNSVTEIGYAALQYTALTQITIPSSVTKIGWYAFQGVSITRVDIADLASWCAIEFSGNLSNPLTAGASLYIAGQRVSSVFDIPEGITQISDYTFYGIGGSVFEVIVPSTVTYIGREAFRYAGFGYLTLQASNMSIGDYAFDTGMISQVAFTGAPPTYVGTDIFGDNYPSIYVPSEYLEAYQALLPQYNITAQ